jgi:AraC-like DNA-binding protein
MDIIWHEDGVMVVGPDTGPHLTSLGVGRSLVALRFAPGVGPAVLGVPAHELLNTRVPLDEVWSARSARLMVDADDPASTLQAVAAQRLSDSPQDQPARSVAQALALTDNGVAAIDVAARCGYSDQAHLSRDVKALSGLTLGQLAANRSTP